ncbi:MAG: TraA family conjugative transfer protein [Nitrospiria bacterium]
MQNDSKQNGHVNLTRQRQIRTKVIALFVMILLTAAATSFAGTTPTATDPFYAAYNLINGWATGTLAKVIALVAFLLGLGFSAAQQSAMPAIMGLVMALLVAVLPTVILSVIGAVI